MVNDRSLGSGVGSRCEAAAKSWYLSIPEPWPYTEELVLNLEEKEAAEGHPMRTTEGSHKGDATHKLPILHFESRNKKSRTKFDDEISYLPYYPASSQCCIASMARGLSTPVQEHQRMP